MSDKLKTLLSILFFVAALTLPVVGLTYGWWKWDLTTGFLIMVIVFLFFSLLGVVTLTRINDLSWLSVSLPFVFSSLYGFLPDAIPFSIDDAAVAGMGAVFSYGLSLRKNPNTPKWIFLPLLAAGLYALFGNTIPLMFDEALVDVLALIIAIVGARNAEKKELGAAVEVEFPE